MVIRNKLVDLLDLEWWTESMSLIPYNATALHGQGSNGATTYSLQEPSFSPVYLGQWGQLT